MPHTNLASLPLAALRAFKTTAWLESNKAAAYKLEVIPSAVNHQLQTLEINLGTTLFEWPHRGLRPTRPRPLAVARGASRQ